VPRTSLALATATSEVARRDPAMAILIERAGPVRFRPREGDDFNSLVRAIAYQQLAGRAAAAIHGRFVSLFEGPPTPEAVLAAPEEALRGAGLSAAKTAAIRDLASKVAAGDVPLRSIRRLPDDEVVARLSSVRGIGRWTAEMFLIFQLRRMDVWPVDDLGVRFGWQLVHGLEAMPSPRALQAEGERFRPYRTVAAWYCWETVHMARGQT
jgi:DNA-3-methyladenine glycosylase II